MGEFDEGEGVVISAYKAVPGYVPLRFIGCMGGSSNCEKS